MPLEHDPQGTTGSVPLKLSEAEVSQLLDRAMARHQESQTLPDKVLGVEDAVEIARSMGIPEEHVLAAAEELRRRRHSSTPVHLTEEERHRRTEIVRSRRSVRFGMSLVGGLAGAVVALFLLRSGVTAFFALLVLGIAAATIFAGFKRMMAPVPEAEIEQLELPPAAGRCRVCGAPAYSPQATFCEQHRYKGPG
jgi:hypothetical protein